MSRTLDFRITILADETIPELVVSIPFGDVAVFFVRFVTTQGLERSFVKLVEVNIRSALLQPRARLENLQPRQFSARQFREPVVQYFVIGCGTALRDMAPGWQRLSRSQLFGETWVIRLWPDWVR